MISGGMMKSQIMMWGMGLFWILLLFLWSSGS